MGDRTHCTVTIHKHYHNQLKQELGEKKLEDTIYSDETNDNGDTVEFICYEANYGNWEEFTNILAERKIEYDRRWESGGEYGAGEESTRNIDGKYSYTEIYDEQIASVDLLKELLAIEDPTKLKAMMLKKLKELVPFEVKPLKAPQSIDFIKNA